MGQNSHASMGKSNKNRKREMKKSILSVLFTLPNLILLAQSQPSDSNLVYNPSFEEHSECPRKVETKGVLTMVDAWYQPTSGSVDYYNTCGTYECKVPKNKLGIQMPQHGEGFCGMYSSKTEYREYLQTQLKKPLLAGATYRLTFYASLSEYSSGSIATMGGLFSKERIIDTARCVLMKKENQRISPTIVQTISTYYDPQVVNPPERVLSDTKEWMEISGTFKAQGGEEFLTIGNFHPIWQSNYTDLNELTYLLPGAYYYIDNVSVICLDCDSILATNTLPPPQPEQPTTYKTGDIIVLKDIYFDFDKSTLLQQSYNTLRDLLNILESNPKMIIEVRGHTDNMGTTEYNQKLSEERAGAVVEYLILKGINQKRLRYTGYGESHPIESNNTPEGRSINRRVEIKILDN